MGHVIGSSLFLEGVIPPTLVSAGNVNPFALNHNSIYMQTYQAKITLTYCLINKTRLSPEATSTSMKVYGGRQAYAYNHNRMHIEYTYICKVSPGVYTDCRTYLWITQDKLSLHNCTLIEYLFPFSFRHSDDSSWNYHNIIKAKPCALKIKSINFKME